MKSKRQPRAGRDFSFSRFFNPDKSPKTQFNFVTGVFDYIAKHRKYKGTLVHVSNGGNTFVRSKEVSFKQKKA